MVAHIFKKWFFMRNESMWENGSVASCILYLGTTWE